MPNPTPVIKETVIGGACIITPMSGFQGHPAEKRGGDVPPQSH